VTNINDPKMNCVKQGRKLDAESSGVMIFPNRSRALAPSWRASVDVSSLDICDEDWDKHDDAKSILRMNTKDLDWFRLSHGVIAIHPVLLYYAIKFDARIDCRLLLL
jgi:hypothetical protein